MSVCPIGFGIRADTLVIVPLVKNKSTSSLIFHKQPPGQFPFKFSFRFTRGSSLS